ncbi:MAG: LLM class flavin-dependent oxidoreductase, partial [Dermatophilaceae bacterium]|nr:LLM class flavin-dependent oxidoreductase [Dermatophilaceae bacterium]
DFTRLEPAEPAAWEQAGATWWVESWWDVPQGAEGLAEVRRRVEAGPPTLR